MIESRWRQIRQLERRYSHLHWVIFSPVGPRQAWLETILTSIRCLGKTHLVPPLGLGDVWRSLVEALCVEEMVFVVEAL